MSEQNRIRPPFEKIVIGPILELGSMLSLGHYMESLKIAKQSSGLSYKRIAINNWKLDGIFSIYRGFFPFGLLQMGKGLPVLFTQGEVKYQLDKSGYNLSNNKKNIISGISAGITQSFVLTPLQRLKTIAITDTNSYGFNSFSILKDLIKNEGLSSLYKGLGPMMYKRSIDWGIRFGTMSLIETQFKKTRGQDYNLTNYEKIISGFTCGMVSCISIPLDVWLANSQKYNTNSNSSYEVIKDLINKEGFKSLTRGLGMRIIHSGYHSAWIIGVGSIIFNK